MKLEKADYNTLGRIYVRTKLQVILEDFMKMDTPCARVVLEEKSYCNIASAQSSFKRAAKRLTLPIKVVCRNNKLYLLRTDLIEDLRSV